MAWEERTDSVLILEGTGVMRGDKKVSAKTQMPNELL